MSLFKVDGWDLKTNKIAFDKVKKNKKVKTNNKEIKHQDTTKHLKNDIQQKYTEKQKFNNKITENNDNNSIDKDSEATQKNNTLTTNKVRKPSASSNLNNNRNGNALNEQKKKELTPLQKKMLAKLSGSRFRWINEKLYTINSNDALTLIADQPELFDEYHEGFRSQVESWPENPVDSFVSTIINKGTKRPINAPGGLPGIIEEKPKGKKGKKVVIADMGCGEAILSLKVGDYFKKFNKKNKNGRKQIEVHSFDLKKINDRITVADIRNVPLPDGSCSIVIFCLSLMSTNFLDFIKEAYRILCPRGELWISEIKSRFGDTKGDEFGESLKLFGFFHKATDDTNKMFTKFEFFKPSDEILQERKEKLERKQKFIEVETAKDDLDKKRKTTPEGKWLLKPCIYKRR
ncbi:25S rRNA (adenine645-N1)-methyltransferase SCDLUD_001646 [Saccharomycodes ludwigii]|uniref:25S rRNA (adenine645-N1)-methyltransferase n=1 Tax=Saccharomycodes ludwigii TaxID=36035 RepID=UPI001E840109|nr:hypothetical protein SCDLUD_001646 [Saccharomycodes ludwigii]KAH3901863.1 hypothetical protein SCDLUD_001646 [Saccharomycodes ludwigii]